MHHTRQTQVLEVHSQSLSGTNLHPHHPHTTHITPQSLSLSLTHSLTLSINRHTTTNTHINNNVTISLTPKCERGQVCATPGRRKCLKSRVSHALPQPCITPSTHNSHHTTITPPHSLTHTVDPSPHHFQHAHQQQYHNITHPKE